MNLLHLDDRAGVRPVRYESLDAAPDTNAAWILGAREARNMWCPGDLEPFDTVLVSMMKNQDMHESSWMSAVPNLKSLGKRVWVFQEGEASWLHYRPDDEQRTFRKNLRHADLMLCHQVADEDAAEFYRDWLGIPTVSVPTQLHLGKITARKTGERSRRLAILATPDERVRGVWALTAAHAACSPEIVFDLLSHDGAGGSTRPEIPEGRECVRHPYLGWNEYATVLAGTCGFVSAINRPAAGRDAILCAHLGIPYLGSWSHGMAALHPMRLTDGYVNMKRAIASLMHDPPPVGSGVYYRLDPVESPKRYAACLAAVGVTL